MCMCVHESGRYGMVVCKGIDIVQIVLINEEKNVVIIVK